LEKSYHKEHQVSNKLTAKSFLSGILPETKKRLDKNQEKVNKYQTQMFI